jgi:hypothetical protein
MQRLVVTLKWTDVSKVIAVVMKAVRTSETSVHFDVTTRLYIPEYSKLQSFPCSQEPAIASPEPHYTRPNILFI